MRPVSPHELNRRSYDLIAARWDEARRGFYGRERDYLDALLAGLPPGSRILDLGCGTGRPIAEAVLARGHHVVGVDQSTELLALARRRFPQATWRYARLEALALAGVYAAVVCWDALFHVERVHHAEILATVARHLAPGGRLMLTVGGSEHPAFVDTMFGQEFFYDSHPPPRVLALLADRGFTPVVSELMNAPTSGRDKGRLAIVAERAAASPPVDSGAPGTTETREETT
jgi:2-polyprenyl-3-methyl-5-hydroxy-6-metoxy-1,4-benzoquinol methylase